MQLNAIFPTVGLAEIIAAVKASDLNFDRALQRLFDQQQQLKTATIPQAKAKEKEAKETEKAAPSPKFPPTQAQPTPASKPSAATSTASSSKGTSATGAEGEKRKGGLEERYADEIRQVQTLAADLLSPDLLALATPAVVAELLARERGVERVVEKLLDAPAQTLASVLKPNAPPLASPPPNTTTATAAASTAVEEKSMTVGHPKASASSAAAATASGPEDEEAEVFLSSEDELSDGEGMEESDEALGLSPLPSVEALRSSALETKISQDLVAEAMARSLQEEADREAAQALARGLAVVQDATHYSLPRSKFAIPQRTGVGAYVSPADGSDAWHFTPADYVPQGAAPRRRVVPITAPATIVQNPMLQEFLQATRDREVSHLFNDAPPNAPSESDTPPASGPRGLSLHALRRELKVLKEEATVLAEEAQARTAARAKQSSLTPHRRKKAFGIAEASRTTVYQFADARPAEAQSEGEKSRAKEALRAALTRSSDSQPAPAPANPQPQHLPPFDRSLVDAGGWERCLRAQAEELAGLREIFGAEVQTSETLPLRLALPIRDPVFLASPAAGGASASEGRAAGALSFSFPRPLRLHLVLALHPAYPFFRAIETVRVRSHSVQRSALLPPALLLALEAHLAALQAAHSTVGPSETGQGLSSLELVHRAEEWLEASHDVRRLAKDATLASSDSADPQGSNVDQDESLRHLLSLNYRVLSVDEILRAQSQGLGQTLRNLAALATPGQSTPSKASTTDSALSKPLVPTDASLRAALRVYGGDMAKLSRAYRQALHTDSLDFLFEGLGVPFVVKDAVKMEERVALCGRESLECPGCLDDLPLDQMCGLEGCGHYYCFNCWENYLRVTISESGGTAGGGEGWVACPGHRCKLLLDSPTIASLIPDDLYSRFISFVVNAYVKNSTEVKWCPQPRGCEFALQVPPSGSKMVECKCGYVFCFACNGEGHWPATCEEVKWWAKAFPDLHAIDPNVAEAKTLQWISSHTQTCPRCSAAIEKNGGCNHMSCHACRHQFCWVCLSDWTSKHYACTAFNSKGRSNAQAALELFNTEINYGFLHMWQVLNNGKSKDERLKSTLTREIRSYFGSTGRDNPQGLAILECAIKAFEYLYLCRHVAQGLCKVGEFFKAHQIGGSKQLKPEIRRLGSDVSLIQNALSVPLRSLKLSEIQATIGAVKASIKHAFIPLGKARLHAKQRAEKLEASKRNRVALGFAPPE